MTRNYKTGVSLEQAYSRIVSNFEIFGKTRLSHSWRFTLICEGAYTIEVFKSGRRDSIIYLHNDDKELLYALSWLFDLTPVTDEYEFDDFFAEATHD